MLRNTSQKYYSYYKYSNKCTYTAAQWVDNQVYNKLGIYKEYPEIYKQELELEKMCSYVPRLLTNICGYIATCML